MKESKRNYVILGVAIAVFVLLAVFFGGKFSLFTVSINSVNTVKKANLSPLQHSFFDLLGEGKVFEIDRGKEKFDNIRVTFSCYKDGKPFPGVSPAHITFSVNSVLNKNLHKIYTGYVISDFTISPEDTHHIVRIFTITGEINLSSTSLIPDFSEQFGGSAGYSPVKGAVPLKIGVSTPLYIRVFSGKTHSVTIPDGETVSDLIKNKKTFYVFSVTPEK